MENLTKDVLANTQWYFMAYPYIPKELVNYPDCQGLKDFDDIGAAWGGTGRCCGERQCGLEMRWAGLVKTRGICWEVLGNILSGGFSFIVINYP